MREVINKADTKKCELCEKDISTYGFPSHLKWEHKTTIDDYVTTYGEYRKSKLKSPTCRKIDKIICQICKHEYSSVGMFTHIRDTHGLTKEQYVSQYGEYNPKKQKLIETDKGISGEFVCLIDNKKFENGQQLYGYITRTYNMSSDEYVLKYIFNGVPPTCKCGCGKLVNTFSYEPYKVDYVIGHNSIGELNPMFGKTHDSESTDKMSEVGLDRVNRYKQLGIPLPMHSPDALIKRGNTYSARMMDLKQIKHNVKIVERNGDFIKFKCLKCDEEHSQYHTSYFICNKCFPPVKSKAENEIKSEIESLFKVDCIQNYRKLFNGTLECDIFIPSANIGIEYNGLYYHSEYAGNKSKSYHLSKTNEFLKKSVKIIHVFEDEWLMKKDIVLSRIGAYLGKFEKKIYARKCEIRSLNFQDTSEFLKNNHIQGPDKHEISYGLYYENSLVSVMTFSKLNIAKGSSHIVGHYELSRFCNSLNTTVIGGVSRLLSHFRKNIKCEKLITYADLRWSDEKSNVYVKNGFNFVSRSAPNYFYMKDYKTRLNRFGFMKSKLVKNGADPAKTEIEIMREMNYDRIWDCGHLKYEMNF
jgi:hypothetical protein